MTEEVDKINNPHPLQISPEQQFQWQQQQQALQQQQLLYQQQLIDQYNSMTPEQQQEYNQKQIIMQQQYQQQIQEMNSIQQANDQGYFPIYVQLPQDQTQYWQFYLQQTNQDPINQYKAPISNMSNQNIQLKETNNNCIDASKDTCFKSCNSFAIFFTPAIFIAAIIILILEVTDSTIFIIVAVFSYIAYLCLAYSGYTFTQISNYSLDIGVNDFLDDVKMQPPHISHYMECYHYENRTSGSGKNRRTRRVKVVTKRAYKNQEIFWWADCSESNISSSEFKLMRFYFFKQFTFEDFQSAQTFAQTKNSHIEQYQNFDKYYNYQLIYEINHFRDTGLFTMQKGYKTIWTNKLLFNIMTLTGLSSCFAFGLNLHSGSKDYKFIKRIRLH